MAKSGWYGRAETSVKPQTVPKKGGTAGVLAHDGSDFRSIGLRPAGRIADHFAIFQCSNVHPDSAAARIGGDLRAYCPQVTDLAKQC